MTSGCPNGKTPGGKQQTHNRTSVFTVFAEVCSPWKCRQKYVGVKNMKKNKGTKRALLGSVLVLLLCMAMLIGSTFAWFTDSTATVVNQIQAGNLDVELYSVNGTTETPVTNETQLFKTGTLWEPGHTEVVKLKVANLGTLALKYRLGINVASETPGTSVKDDKEFNLSSYIKFALIEGNNDYADSAAAIDAAEATGKATAISAEGKFDGTLYPTGTEGKTSEKYVTLVVYMPTTVGNEANYKLGTEAPTIDLGISLEATQVPYEEDSFGPDYDDEAWKALNAEKVEKNGDIQKALEDALTEGSGYVQLTDTVNKDFATSYDNAIEVPEGKEVKIDFAGNALNITTGNAYDSGKYGGIVAEKGSNLTLSNGTVTKDKSNGSGYPVIKADHSEVTLDGMTVTLTAETGNCVHAGSDGGKVIIKNSTVTGPNSTYSNAAATGSQATLEIINSTIIGGIRVENNGNLIIRSGNFVNATFYFGGSSGTHIVYAGTFADNPTTLGLRLAEGSTAVDNGDGTWTVSR